jgi:hypothetical protein
MHPAVASGLTEAHFLGTMRLRAAVLQSPYFLSRRAALMAVRASQPSGKNAADFVDWKFVKDYGLERIHLDVMMASHNDADHYGGLSDLLGVDTADEL